MLCVELVLDLLSFSSRAGRRWGYY